MASLPPGPRAPALIQMLRWILWPIPFLEGCRRRYGDVFMVRFVIGDIVFVTDPELIKTIFRGDPDTLHAGEANAAPLESLMGRNSVLLLDGPEHMRQRKLMLPSFHGDRMSRYGDLIREITETEIERWPVGEPFALRPRTQAITLEVIMRAVFGIEDAERLDHLRDRINRLLDIGNSRLALAAIALPVVRNTLGKRTWARFERLRADVDEMLYDEIARRREDPTTPERDDVLSILLQARDEEGNAMTDVELRDELVTLLAAGHETTATALAWAFDLLLHNPGSLERLQAEIADGSSDEYLGGVIEETLRVRPVVPGVMRKLKAPFQLDGYELQPGMRVAPNIYLTHRRSDVYPDPEAFRPERFLEQPTETYSWIPFGGGIRRCLGASFAIFEMKVAITTVLKRLELRAARREPDRIRRRAITFAPERDAMVVVERRKERPAPLPEDARAAV